MKSLLWLTEQVLQESGTRCGADPSADIRRIRSRTEHEGESFLTITLPSFCQAFDRALAEGVFEPTTLTSFHWHRRGLPEFLRGFLLKVFSPDGRLLPAPCVETISCIRQICLMQKKIQRPCTDVRERRALAGYKECENEVKAWKIDEPFHRAFRAVSRVVWAQLLSGTPFGDPYDLLRPKHGPGATAERVRGNAKFLHRRWHTRLEAEFPYTEFGLASVRNVESNDPLSSVDFVEPANEQPVRVVFVPKTQKTPRVIAIEPVCMQYMQQALLQWLVPLIEGGAVTGGRVNFTRQSINANLALTSSADGRFATIDLSEASDRVSSELVASMLEVCPRLRDQIFACRSTRARLPDSTTVELSKFASMGSALCFPMEAMVFFITIVTSRLLRTKSAITDRTVALAASDLYVYGDDILVPTDEAPAACDALRTVGLKVNQHKSFWTGRFRESCGVDAYDGTNVTPTYVRHEFPTSRRDASAVASWVATANLLYEKGWWSTVREIRSRIESVVGKLPHLGDAAFGLHWTSYSKVASVDRWNKDLMRFETRTWALTTTKRGDPLEGDPALMKCFGVIGNDNSPSSEHLERTVVRGRLALRRRWVPSL